MALRRAFVCREAAYCSEGSSTKQENQEEMKRKAEETGRIINRKKNLEVKKER